MKSKAIKFRCTEVEFSKIKALGGSDMSAWILSKLLSPTIDIGHVERKRNAERLSTEIPKAPTVKELEGSPCMVCGKPYKRMGWHNGLITPLCIEHS